MSPVIVGIIAFVILLTLLAFRTHIGIGMALIGFLGMWYLLSYKAGFVKLAIVPFETAYSYELAVLPLFLLMAHIVFSTGMGTDMFNLAAKWLGHQPGGVCMATVAGCAGFAAVSASSIATAATMGLVALPEMRRLKYDPALATGSIAAGGTIGVLIPPSGVMIIYGILTETSIGRLFIGGIIPGILEAVFYMVTIYILCTWRPHLGPRGSSSTFREKILAFGSCGEIIALIILVLAGLFVGWFTPTEAGAVGAFGAILFSTVRKRLNWEKLKGAFIETIKTSGMIYCILIGAFVFNFFLATTNIPFIIADFVSALPLPPLGVMAIIMVVYLGLGCFLDAAAMTVLTIPIFFPLAMSLGFHPIWFGVLVVRAMEMAMITPPIGMNVYVIAGVAKDVPMQTIFKGIFPFLIADIFHVALLMFVPALSLYLPSIMK
jgi:C4-dicarboxylate transporter DctM subunit